MSHQEVVAFRSGVAIRTNSRPSVVVSGLAHRAHEHKPDRLGMMSVIDNVTAQATQVSLVPLSVHK